MVIVKQMTMFAFDDSPKSTEPIWMVDFENEHMQTYRMDAEAIVNDLNRMPSGEGSWLRCLEVDHSRSYESQFRDWDACIWWHYLDGKQIRPWKYKPLTDAWIDDDILHIKLDSGEYLVQIVSNDQIDRYDYHPYDPSYDLEHFAIECYRHHIPREMMSWRKEYIYGTPALRPFVHNISTEDAKKIDLMGNIPNSMIFNKQFVQICDCAEMIGIELKLSYDVSALENLAMYPVEKNCKSCLRKKSSNKNGDSICWKNENNCGCSKYKYGTEKLKRKRSDVMAGQNQEIYHISLI